MALKPFPFNNTDGTTVTTGNSGAAAVSVGAGGSCTYRTAAAHQGTTGVRFAAAGAAVTLRGGFVNANPSQAASSVVMKIPASAPSADLAVLTFNDTTLARQSSIIYASGANAGRFYTNDKNNTYTPLVTAAQVTASLTAGTFVRIEHVVTNTSATAGAFTARLYNADTGVQIGSTVSVTNGNLGGNNIGGVTIGVNASITYTLDMDSFQTNDGATSEIGAYSSTTNPPTVTPSADIDAGTTTGVPIALGVTSTTDTANGATLDHYNWTVVTFPPELGSPPSITSPTTAAPQFTPAVSGLYQFAVTATDSTGQTSAPATQTVYVRGTVVEAVLPLSNIGGWTISSLANLTDNSDASDLAAPTSAISEATYTAQLAPLINGPSSWSFPVKYKLDAAASGVTFKVRLIEGSTVRKEWTPTAPTTTAQTYDCSLPNGDAVLSAVTDWKALKIQFAWQTTT